MMNKVWTYSECESCASNAHEKVKMIKEKMISEDGKELEMWICQACGFSRRF